MCSLLLIENRLLDILLLHGKPIESRLSRTLVPLGTWLVAGIVDCTVLQPLSSWSVKRDRTFILSLISFWISHCLSCNNGLNRSWGLASHLDSHIEKPAHFYTHRTEQSNADNCLEQEPIKTPLVYNVFQPAAKPLFVICRRPWWLLELSLAWTHNSHHETRTNVSNKWVKLMIWNQHWLLMTVDTVTRLQFQFYQRKASKLISKAAHGIGRSKCCNTVGWRTPIVPIPWPRTTTSAQRPGKKAGSRERERTTGLIDYILDITETDHPWLASDSQCHL